MILTPVCVSVMRVVERYDLKSPLTSEERISYVGDSSMSRTAENAKVMNATLVWPDWATWSVLLSRRMTPLEVKLVRHLVVVGQEAQALFIVAATDISTSMTIDSPCFCT